MLPIFCLDTLSTHPRLIFNLVTGRAHRHPRWQPPPPGITPGRALSNQAKPHGPTGAVCDAAVSSAQPNARLSLCAAERRRPTCPLSRSPACPSPPGLLPEEPAMQRGDRNLASDPCQQAQAEGEGLKLFPNSNRLSDPETTEISILL